MDDPWFFKYLLNFKCPWWPVPELQGVKTHHVYDTLYISMGKIISESQIVTSHPETTNAADIALRTIKVKYFESESATLWNEVDFN